MPVSQEPMLEVVSLKKTTIVTSTQTPLQQSGESKFKEDLKTYFPDLYKFWSLYQFDPHYEQVLEGILEMTQGHTGTLRVIYQSGKINQVTLDKVLTTNTKNRVHY